jgi:prolyl-tRNA editing enzyme YbaK/EbsC (Cys-tRNA(Pro) deacylase)
MHPSSERVQQVLREGGCEAEVVELETSTRTAEEAAASLGVEVSQIVKSLVFVADGEPVLVLVPGDRRVDAAKAKVALGASSFERADPETVRSATGCPIGGVAPVGHPTRLRTLVDSALSRHEELWAAAGTPRTVFPVSPAVLVRLTGGVVDDLS